MKTLLTMISVGAAVTSGVAGSPPENLLRNPEFRFHARLESGRPGGEQSHNVACWQCENWGDITVVNGSAASVFEAPVAKANAVRIEPGKQLSQFAALPEIGCIPGDELTVFVRGHQAAGGNLRARVTLMQIESADGTWSPKDFGCGDKRVFSCHGRGELVRGPSIEAVSGDAPGEFTVLVPSLPITACFKKDKASSAKYENSVGVLVEFINLSKSAPVWITTPYLGKSAPLPESLLPGRSVPDYYRRMPRTIGKLLAGKPIHILALGSSIDTGDANPRLYLYDEDPKSPTYKQPLCDGKFDADSVGRPDLDGYLYYPKQYVKYTGRLRRELMRKFNLQVSDILLNAMSCGGSSIGESHSGLEEYASLTQEPGPLNGHPTGKAWGDLYPKLFRDGKRPPPDLVVFGHGHNERIDSPDGVAVYEGAVRWFQKHYPEVEFLFCQWHTSSTSTSNIPPIPIRREFCAHYGIPFIDIIPVIEGLEETCNFYALCPDGGHPQAGAHAIWFRQIEQAFEMADPLEEFLSQQHLPRRFNEYSYGWEGELITITPPNPRLRGPRLIIEDTAFNLWATDGTEDRLKIVVDGEPVGSDAGRGTQRTRRDVRNSSFVHGRLSLGDRHVIEVQGKEEVTIHAADLKVCDRRQFLGPDSPAWKWSAKPAPVVEFKSEWGAPYGNHEVVLQPGESMSVEMEATDLSVAYVDIAGGGRLLVDVDGENKLSLETDQPFVDSSGASHFMENRRGIRGMGWKRHRVTLRAESKPVHVLGLFTYDSR